MKLNKIFNALAIIAIIATTTTAFAQQNEIRIDCDAYFIFGSALDLSAYPQWRVGGGTGQWGQYSVGSRVVNNGKFYECINPSNFNADFIGAPGIGTHWQMFWQELECMIFAPTFIYDGNEKTLSVLDGRFFGRNVLLTEGIDYTTYNYRNNINAGLANVRITGTEIHPFLDATINFTISRRTINVNWGGDLISTFDGTPKTVTAWTDDNLFPITAVSNGTQTNAGTHTASVALQTPNASINLQNATRQFTINRAQGHGSVTLAGWRAASQPNDPIPFSETNGIVGVTFTYRSIDASYPETPARPANPGHYIVKAIFPQVQNYNGFTAESNFTISNRDAEPLEVVWTEQTEFVFNKMVQSPIPTARNKDGEDISLMVLNGQSAAGEYSGSRAAMAIIRDEWVRQFYYLTNNTIDYTIHRRPLNVVMRDRNGNRRDTITTEENIITSGDLFDYIESILGFDNFATDTIRNETDNESVLRGKPRIGLQSNNSQRSLRNNDIILDRNIVLPIGERFLIAVKTDSITADNYTILERNIAITITGRFITLATDPRENPTSIVNVRRADKRYGIKFAVNPVSEKAEISVILQNNERAVETKIVVYDMTGNVVFSTTARDNVAWDLRNSAGRFVANGTYLVVAEVKDRSGRTHAYSARLGVKR